jgi:mannan endo-1,4-beta-mannosidase
MKLYGLALALLVSVAVKATPVLLPASATQPAASYPIGKASGSNAKVSGRLFEIDGKVQYFAGWYNISYEWTDC